MLALRTPFEIWFIKLLVPLFPLHFLVDRFKRTAWGILNRFRSFILIFIEFFCGRSRTLDTVRQGACGWGDVSAAAGRPPQVDAQLFEKGYPRLVV